jgi:hypothetical protein
MDHKTSVFQEIYLSNIWGRGSGYGSTKSATKHYRKFLKSFIGEHHIKTVTELGCGDFQLMRHVDLTEITYTGYDVASSVVEQNIQKFAKSNLTFKTISTYSDMEKAELLICKDVLQHLPLSEINAIISQCFTNFNYVLVTNCVGNVKSSTFNNDVGYGDFTNIRILEPPFSLVGTEVLRWRSPIRSIILPDIGVTDFLLLPLRIGAVLRQSLNALVKMDRDLLPIWTKSTVLLVNNC